MKKKALKNKNSKTAVIFPNWAVDSPDMFLHCARIPDVMVHIVKIREIYRRYKMSAPAYLFLSSPFGARRKSILRSTSLTQWELNSTS